MSIISKHSYNDKYMLVIKKLELSMVATIFKPNTQRQRWWMSVN